MSRVVFSSLVASILTAAIPGMGLAHADDPVPALSPRATPAATIRQPSTLTLPTGVQPGTGVVAPVPPPQPDVPTPILQRQTYADVAELVRKARGSVVLVHVWGAFCPPCREEFPALIRVAERYRNHPFEILACACDISPVTTMQFLKDKEMNFQCIYLTNRDGTPLREAGINLNNRVPYTAILDTSGKVVKEWSGSRDYKTYCGILDELYRTAAPVHVDLPVLALARKPEVSLPVTELNREPSKASVAPPPEGSARLTTTTVGVSAGIALLGFFAVAVLWFRR